MTDQEYAARIYCQVFKAEYDGGDAYTQGIQSAIGTLGDREQIMLENYYRHGRTYVQMGNEFCLSGQKARQIVQKALLKLRHPSRSRNMSIAQVAKDRDMYKDKLAEANDTINELSKLAASLSKGISTNEELQAILVKQETCVCDIGLSRQAKGALLRASKQTVKSILSITTWDELCGIRNFGVKSRGEVLVKMRELGFHEWADRMDAEGNRAKKHARLRRPPISGPLPEGAGPKGLGE